MKHCGTQELETERLVLRRLSIDDSEMMFNNWASDRQVTQYLRWNAHRSWGETAETLNEWEKHYGDPTFYQWGVENKRSGVLMGTISQEDLEKIAELIETVKYGTVTIVIQDGKIVQLEKHEKLRLT